jgi:hypothetical protein
MKENDSLIKNVEKETWQMVYDFWKARKTTMNDVEREWRTDQFRKFTNEYDKRRERNFKDVFKELSEWI